MPRSLFVLATMTALAGCSQGKSGSTPLPRSDVELLSWAPPGTYAVIVHALGYGTGTIVIDPSQTCVTYDWEDSAHYSQVCWAFLDRARTDVTLQALPTNESRFLGWGVAPCVGSTDPTCVVQMGKDQILNVRFDPGGATGPKSEYKLTVNVLGFVDGSITAPAGVGLSCQESERASIARTCLAVVPATTPPSTVTLTATPLEAGSVFLGWGANCSGTGTCTVTMDRDVGVTAGFGRGTTPGGGGGQTCGAGFHDQNGACAPDVVACAMPNGSGTQSWNGSSYDACTLSTCNTGFASCDGASANGCEVPLQSDIDNCGACGHVCPRVTNGTATCVAGTCGLSACSAGYALSNGTCIPIIVACTVANGSGTQTWNGTAYGACELNACTPGFANCDGGSANGCEVALQTDVANCGSCGHACPAVPNGTPGCTAGTCGTASCIAGYALSNGACIPTTISCAVAHGTGSQTWNGSAYGPCNVTGCDAGYHAFNGACDADVVVCQVPNGSGTQTWNGSAYGPCNVTSCSVGYHLAAGACDPNVLSCPIPNGTGTQTWNGIAYGACTATSCNAGFALTGGACVRIGCGTLTGGTVGSWVLRNAPNLQGPGWTEFGSRKDGNFVGSFYSVAGNRLQQYTPSSNAWTNRAAPPTPVGQWASPAWIGDFLYVIQTNFVQRYSVSTNTWTSLASGVTSTTSSQNAHDEAGNVYAVATNGSIVRYDVAANALTSLTGLSGLVINEPRLTYDPCSGLLVAAPSFNGSQVFGYDPSSNVLQALAPIPDSQVNTIFCSDRSGHVYAGGSPTGMTIWQLTIATGAWTQLPALPFDHGNNGACTVTADGYLYVTNGVNGSTSRVARIQLQ